MKIKQLLIAGLIAVSGAFALSGNVFAIDPDIANGDTGSESSGGSGGSGFSSADCPSGSLFKTKPAKAKPAGEIKTLADCNLARDDHDLMETVQTIINAIVAVVGVIAVAVIVLGGVFYVTSTGEAAKIKRAQNTILYGVIGLIVALLAYAAVNFVLANIF